MLPKILKLESVQTLDRDQQKIINGGSIPLPPDDDCGCIVRTPEGYLEIVAVLCSSTCPDGTNPIPGLGF